MYISCGEFEDGSGYIKGNRDKNNGVVVKFKAEGNV